MRPSCGDEEAYKQGNSKADENAYGDLQWGVPVDFLYRLKFANASLPDRRSERIQRPGLQSRTPSHSHGIANYENAVECRKRKELGFQAVLECDGYRQTSYESAVA